MATPQFFTPVIVGLSLLASAPAALAFQQEAAPETLTGEVEVEPDGTQRFSVLLTYGDEKCPDPVEGEILVCASFPENERYRIPEILRVSNLQVSTGQAWTSVVETLDEIARVNRPNSCSAVGSNGFTGCASAALRRWFDERRAIRDAEIEAKAKEEPEEVEETTPE